jgi:hypothetical protein
MAEAPLEAVGEPLSVGGRPVREFDPHLEGLVRALCKLGATDFELAQAMGTNVNTLKQWMVRYPRFFTAIKLGKRAANKRVERSLYNRAIGYSFESEKVFCTKDGEIVRAATIEHVPPETKAGIFWLLNRRKQEWRNYKHTELSTAPGKPLEIAPVMPAVQDLLAAHRERTARIAAPRRGSADRRAPRIVEHDPDGGAVEG